MSLYTGDFLPQDEAGWIIRHRDQLRTLYVKGVLDFCAHCLQRQEYENAFPFLEQARQSDPLHEGIYACLMQIYLRMGYPAKALGIFQHAREVLAAELGIAPGTTLLVLARQAKQQG